MDGKKNKILVLTSTYPRHEYDATPAFIKQLCERLSDSYEVHVLAPHAAGLSKKERDGRIELHRFVYAPEVCETLAYDGGMLNKIKQSPLRILLLPSFLLAETIQAARVCRRYDIDAIHAHWIIPQGVVGALIKRLYGIPVLVTAHGGDLYGLNGFVWKHVRGWVIKNADHVATVSRTMKDMVIRHEGPSTKFSVASMGVDLKGKFVPAETETRKPRILFLGRLVEKKGAAYAVAAIKRLIARDLHCVLDIVGDGPERKTLEELVVEENVEKHVFFHGAKHSSEVVKFYQNAILFIMPSVVASGGDQEGLGLVAVEAMGCGCPVVASDLPAIRDVVQHEKTGLLCEPADANALANAIARLMKDYALRDKLAKSARQYVVSRFDWPVAAERYKDIIASLIKKPC